MMDLLGSTFFFFSFLWATYSPMEKYLITGTLINQDLERFFDLTQHLGYITSLTIILSFPSLAVEITYKRESEKWTINKTLLF